MPSQPRRDHIAPVTTLSIAGTALYGPFTLTLRATDTGGSELAKTVYRKNGTPTIADSHTHD